MTLPPDPIRLELLKHVERAVRPVVAPRARKMQMRAELLAHLSELYEEESKRGSIPGVVLESAVARFGEPAELTRSLQESVSRWSRWLAWFTAGKPTGQQSMFAVAARFTTAMLMLVGVLMVPLWMIVMFRFAGDWDTLRFLLRVTAVMFIVYAIGAFVLTLISQAMVRVWLGGFLRRGALLRAAALTVTSGMISYLLVAGFFAGIFGQLAAIWSEFPLLRGFLIFGSFMLLAGTFAHVQEVRRESEWTDLVLSD